MTPPARVRSHPSPARPSARRTAPVHATPALRLVPRPKLRVVDVALFYGERSGGIRTYLDAKLDYAVRSGAFEHHLVIPGVKPALRPHAAGAVHVVPGVRVARSNGYRWPLGTRRLAALLRELEPDVVLQHDPFWAPLAGAAAAHAGGARVVMVHHGSVALDAAAFRGPLPLYRAALGAWLRHAYKGADTIMSAVDPTVDVQRAAGLELRFGLDPAFRPRAGVHRGDHVLYAGRLGREKGIFSLLEAAKRSREPWPLWLMGTGPAERHVAAVVRKLGLTGRVRFLPHLTSREALARAYQRARVVVMPGELETFGLVAYEAVASGARAVACTNAPSARLLGELAHRFEPGDVDGLLQAIEAARASEPDLEAATAFSAAHQWDPVFAHELLDLELLVGAR